MPKLIVTTEAAGRVAHELIEELITIGRAPDNMIVLDNGSVSSRHAELRLVEENYQLRDLGSTNGTRVNGDPAKEATLRQGDRIRFGGVEARFEAIEAKSTQPLPVAEKIEVKAAETSARPADFANASPFRARNKQRDPSRTAIFIMAALAMLALILGLIAVFTMHPPMP